MPDDWKHSCYCFSDVGIVWFLDSNMLIEGANHFLHISKINFSPENLYPGSLRPGLVNCFISSWVSVKTPESIFRESSSRHLLSQEKTFQTQIHLVILSKFLPLTRILIHPSIAVSAIILAVPMPSFSYSHQLLPAAAFPNKT